jgi:hypothetical protein
VHQAYPAEAYAVKRGLGRCWGFGVLSFGAWTYYWFYVHRKLLDGELGGARDDAVLHTLGLFVPVLNFFILYWLWRDLNLLRQSVGLPEFPVVPYVIGSIFLAPVFYSLVVGKLNEYWDTRLGGLAGDAPVTTAEKVIIGIGVGLWVLWFLTILLTILIVILAESSS